MSIEIADGTLKALLRRRARPTSIRRFRSRIRDIEASLTGTGKRGGHGARAADATTPTAIADYDVSGTLAAAAVDGSRHRARSPHGSTRRCAIRSLTIDASLGRRTGARRPRERPVVLSGDSVTSDLEYELVRADLAKLGTLAGHEIAGTLIDERTRHRPVTRRCARPATRRSTSCRHSASRRSRSPAQYDVDGAVGRCGSRHRAHDRTRRVPDALRARRCRRHPAPSPTTRQRLGVRSFASADGEAQRPARRHHRARHRSARGDDRWS